MSEIGMTYDDRPYGDVAEQADGPEGCQGGPVREIPAEDVDAALRRIEQAIDDGATITQEIKDAIARERERLGLRREVRA